MEVWRAEGFEAKMEAAMKKMKTMLKEGRDACLPADVPHTYEDKYDLVENVTNSALACLLGSLELFGLSKDTIDANKAHKDGQPVLLCFKSTEKCAFDCKKTREEAHPRKVEADTRVTNTHENDQGDFSKTTKTKTTSYKVSTLIDEFFWNFEVEYKFFLEVGREPRQVELVSNKMVCKLKTATDAPPRPELTCHPSMQADITWLLSAVDEQSVFHFKVDRNKGCRTPRRNVQVEALLASAADFRSWCQSVGNYFSSLAVVAGQLPSSSEQVGELLERHQSFIPVYPFFFVKQGDDEGRSEAPQHLFPLDDLNSMIQRHKQDLSSSLTSAEQELIARKGFLGPQEGRVLCLLFHLLRIVEDHHRSVNHVEDGMREQLISAIGKEILPSDFLNYMCFHYRRFFLPSFAPSPFSFAIRRPDHFPDGALTMECKMSSSDQYEPVLTFRKETTIPPSSPMRMKINSGTQVSFCGQQHLHGWISFDFAEEEQIQLKLCARARQFSSFLVLIGTVVSKEEFEAKHASILQNKDELEVPLRLSSISSPKEFRDAIESLSPEQQAFARSYRKMQLGSTVFAVLVIEIKPQLEKLLSLAPDSLKKEVKLTQDLMELFLKYQIPSDLLTFDGDLSTPAGQRVEQIKEHVNKVKSVISETQEEQLKLSALEADMAMEELTVKECYSTACYAMPPPAPPPCVRRMCAPGAAGAAAPAMERMMSMEKMPTKKMKSGNALPKPTPTPTPAETGSSGKQQQSTQESSMKREEAAEGGREGELDITNIPVALDKRMEEVDEEGAMRACVLKPDKTWKKRTQKNLLAAPETLTLQEEEQRREKDKAFDLLDALSRSGNLLIDACSLHVVFPASHRFDKSLIETVTSSSSPPAFTLHL
uniref:Uncharacterized protein n=1 Tax=Guillardia theta TaxID=55529 RepID=A0A7S4LZJ0_GUITH|mmetsp:Transcript_10117/g.33708  ORF Transcript_10117/g.33708 Transcript_10117/m.33708 type:complete len:880 (+) Transcript_10117:49-2688(+)